MLLRLCEMKLGSVLTKPLPESIIANLAPAAANLLRAEATHRHAASIRYRMTAAKLPAVKDLDAFVFDDTPINEGLVRSLHGGSFLSGRRNVVLVDKRMMMVFDASNAPSDIFSVSIK